MKIFQNLNSYYYCLKEHIIKCNHLINKTNQLNEANENRNCFKEESIYDVAKSILKYKNECNIDYLEENTKVREEH